MQNSKHTSQEDMEMEGVEKGIVCVTGGTGYVASWLIMRLLQHAYSVRMTIRSDPDQKKDVSYLTNLPGASERLEIFRAELDKPESFYAAIEGCIGVFHVAHPMSDEEKETEEMKIKRAISGTLGILQACLNSKTVRRVVYTSSASTVMYNYKDLDIVDESWWTDVDYMRAEKPFPESYVISKILTEQAAFEFAEKHGLDLVSVVPSYIHGPFICPRCPGSVRASMAMIFGEEDFYGILIKSPFVHIDDVASAHIFLFEYPHAKGRYNCSALEITIDKLSEFLSARYPEYHQIPTADFLKKIKGPKTPHFSSKKLLDTGFKYKYGLEDMFDGAIQCCKQRGCL